MYVLFVKISGTAVNVGNEGPQSPHRVELSFPDEVLLLDTSSLIESDGNFQLFHNQTLPELAQLMLEHSGLSFSNVHVTMKGLVVAGQGGSVRFEPQTRGNVHPFCHR